MNSSTNAACWYLPNGLAAKEQAPELEFIMCGWPVVAAIAWSGYQEHGRGTVMLNQEGCGAYVSGSPCPCHQQLVDTYEPEQQAVVALYDGQTIHSIHVVAGWPAPPDAYRVTPGERGRLTEH